MNQIDQLISQAGIQGTFDLRCLYRGGFRLPHAQSPAGVMPFHLLMKGEIRVSTAQGDDVVLRPGDLLLLPGGEPHTIWREGDTLALAEPGDGLLPLRGDGGDQVIDVGVARPRAQGQAITITATAFSSACCQSPLASPHPTNVTAAMTKDTEMAGPVMLPNVDAVTVKMPAAVSEGSCV